MADIEKNSGNGVHDAAYHPFLGYTSIHQKIMTCVYSL